MASLLSFVMLSLVGASGMAAPPSHPDCPTLMYSEQMGAAIPPSFPGVVAHGVHSLTLPDIHFYFPTNSSDIRMPVVNPDLLSMEPILFKPPDFKHSFQSPAMRAVDRVLSHLNSPHYDIRIYTDLEKLVHAAHMQDIWQQASIVYKEIIENVDDGPSPGLCRCIRDVEHNGVVKMLKLIALKLREPGLMFGQHEEFNPEESRSSDGPLQLFDEHFDEQNSEAPEVADKVNGRNGWDGNLYSYHFVDQDKEATKVADKVNDRNGWDGNLYSYHFVDQDKEATKVADKVNQQEGHFSQIKKRQYLSEGNGEDLKPLTHLEQPSDWETWKQNMLTMKPHLKEYSKILALYMHCMLNF